MPRLWSSELQDRGSNLSQGQIQFGNESIIDVIASGASDAFNYNTEVTERVCGGLIHLLLSLFHWPRHATSFLGELPTLLLPPYSIVSKESG